MDIIIKSGTLVTAAETFVADILVQNERISQIGKDLSSSNAQIIDASGMMITPGGVDPHTHFALPMMGTVSSDDHYTGHKAAAFGGTTTVLDFVPLDKPTLRESVQAWHNIADNKAAVDFSFHMNITRWDEAIAAELPDLLGMGINSVKVFTAYNNRLRLLDDQIFVVMRLARQHGLLTMVHAENGDVIELLIQEALDAGHTTPEWHARTRPAWGAVEATLRSASLAAQAQAPVYIVHMNAAGEVDQLEYAQEQGVAIYGETCPQYLLLTADELSRPDGAKFVCSPPLRGARDNQRLWQGLASGSLQVIGTDHCPFFYNGTQPIRYEGLNISIPGKELGAHDFTKIPNGLPAVGDRLPVLWTYGVRAGKISPNQFVALTSTNPAKIFGLYPRKGSILPGADADLVLWDTEKTFSYGATVARHRTDYNLFEGWKLTGYPQKVFLRGRLIVDGEKWLGYAGNGKYLARNPFVPVRV